MGLDNLQIERSLLAGKWNPQIADDPLSAVWLAKAVVDGRFRDALTSSTARALFRIKTPLSDHSFDQAFTLRLHDGHDGVEEELLRLTLAIACLHAFVQVNWTGPDLDVQPLDVIVFEPDTLLFVTEDSLNDKAISELAYGGEPAYHLAKVAIFLRLAQLILALPYYHCHSAAWWRLRTAYIHQQVLDEPVALPSTVLASLKSLEGTFLVDPAPAGQLLLEQGLLEHQLSHDKSAAEYFIRAAKATGLDYELTGALGKRTKFQEVELSQLVLLAESHLTDDSSHPENDRKTAQVEDQTAPSLDPGTRQSNIPETLALNDDTLLEQTEFTSTIHLTAGSRLNHLSPSSQPPLHPIDQCILLSLCLNVKNTSPSHGLTNEQMSAYVSRVISHPRNWSIHTMALLLRSRLESTRTRTVERSTLQHQALIDQMPTSDSTITERLLYFHSIPLSSRWEMERELATRLMSIGVVKSALDIFERLEMWEDVVKCWDVLERPANAIAIVRDLLDGRKEDIETVLSRGKATSATRRQIRDKTREAKLWCLLGDLEPENAAGHYSRAWTISEKTSGRAMRSLGGYYFARGQYGQAISCLKQAVAINPLLSRPWFILGCACMREESWEEAKNAFSRCVAIDEEDGESWNNLASMYLRIGTVRTKLGQSNDDIQADEEMETLSSRSADKLEHTVTYSNKLLAFRALKEGLRFSYNNWRMWYNYMIVSMDLGELFEASRALARVVEETSDKVGAGAVDEDVLERLVDAVTRTSTNPDHRVEGANTQDAAQDCNEDRGLSRNVSNLFEQTLLPRVSSPRVFRAYARLLNWQSRWDEMLKAYLDGYRCSTAGTLQDGETDFVTWREAVGEVEEIVDILRNFGRHVQGFKWRLQGRSIVRTFIGRSRNFEDEPEWTRLTELQDELRKEN